MGQYEIVQILKENKGKMLVKDIQKVYQEQYNYLNKTSIATSLRKLRKFKLVKYKEIKNNFGATMYEYWY